MCIDLPGHGLSDHYPRGMIYSVSDIFTVILRIMDYFQWDKCSIIGHSLGGAIASYHTALFPDLVETLVSLDLATISPLPLNKHVKSTRTFVKKSVEITDKMDNHPEPSYSFEEAVARAYMANHIAHGEGSISQRSVETILARNMKPSTGGDGLAWGVDLRLRIPSPSNILEETAAEYASKIACPHLFIKVCYMFI